MARQAVALHGMAYRVSDGVLRQAPQRIFTAALQDELNDRGENALGFLNRFALAIGSRHFRADGPVTAFLGRLDDRGKLDSHRVTLSCRQHESNERTGWRMGGREAEL